MANSVLTGKVVNLDTFTSAISMSQIKIHSIEWANPEFVGDRCVIAEGAGGIEFVDWTCHTESYPHIKYFGTAPMDIYIGVAGVGSGSLIIMVR